MKKIITGSIMALFLAGLLAACALGGPDTPPIVKATVPANADTSVATNYQVLATFDKAIAPESITPDTFVVAGLDGTPVPGALGLTADQKTVIFTPSSDLATGTDYTATLTTGVMGRPRSALATAHTWTFKTGPGAKHGPPPVVLGTAGSFVILAKTGISTVPASAITGNLGVSPAAATYMTGFSLKLDSSGTFSTATQVTGRLYAASYTAPTPANLTTAVSNMQTAYTNAAGRTLPDFTELGAGNISGLTLKAGLYKWGTGVSINSNLTLSGSSSDVWIFQIAGNLTLANAKRVILVGGALPKNVFWQVAGGAGVNLGTTAHLEGVVLAQTAIHLKTSASANSRLLAQTAVTLDKSTVVQPAP